MQELWVIEHRVGERFEVIESIGTADETFLAVYRNEDEARSHIDLHIEDSCEALKSGDIDESYDADDFRPALLADCTLSSDLAERLDGTDALSVPHVFVAKEAQTYMAVEFKSTTYREYRVTDGDGNFTQGGVK